MSTVKYEVYIFFILIIRLFIGGPQFMVQSAIIYRVKLLTIPGMQHTRIVYAIKYKVIESPYYN